MKKEGDDVGMSNMAWYNSIFKRIWVGDIKSVLYRYTQLDDNELEEQKLFIQQTDPKGRTGNTPPIYISFKNNNTTNTTPQLITLHCKND